MASGTAPGTAVYIQSSITNPADITNAGGLSRYGTMAQAGNVWEWTESAYDSTNSSAGEPRAGRDGYWFWLSTHLRSSYRAPNSPDVKTGIHPAARRPDALVARPPVRLNGDKPGAEDKADDAEELDAEEMAEMKKLFADTKVFGRDLAAGGDIDGRRLLAYLADTLISWTTHAQGRIGVRPSVVR